MKQTHFFKTLLLLLAIVGVSNAWAAPGDATAIPTTAGDFISWNNCTITGNGSVENSGANIGSTRANTVATFNINNTTQQDYVLTFATGSQNAATMQVTVTNTATSDVVLTKNVTIPNTGSWTPSATNLFLLSQLPAGSYELKFRVTEATGYAGNWGKLAFYTTDALDLTPGTLTLAKGTYNGPKLENGDTNVGFIQNGGTAAYQFINNMGGVYKMTFDMARYNDGNINIVVKDEDGNEEVNTDYAITSANPGSYTSTDILLPGEMGQGIKSMTFTFTNGGGYICNYKAPTFTKVYDHLAAVTGVVIAGQTVTAGDNSDWYCALPVSYDANTTFSVSKSNGIVAVSAKDGSDADVSVTDNGDGTYTIATPALSATTTVTVALTPNSGCLAEKDTYTFKIFRIGEISLTAVTVDGAAVDVLGDINNNPYSATYSACYTAAPVVTATQIDEAAATVDAPSISGSTYTYTIHGSMAGGTITRDYTLILNNVHVYAPAVGDETVNIKANEGTIESNTWSNGVYTLATTSLDSYNQFFKMNGDSYTLSVPSDVVVKQVIMKDCSNNYAGNDARLTAVTNTGATAYIPVDNKYYHSSEGAQHDIIVNLEGHTAGTDIVLTQQKKGQPMAWIQLTVEKQDPGTAPEKTAEEVNVVKNHAVVTLTFDREIPNNVTATINGGTVTAEGGSAVLTFPVWNLSYSTNYTLSIAAGAVQDAYGNTNNAAIEIAVNTSAKAVVEKKTYDYVVATADELKAAISAIDATNTNSSASRKVIFLKNGTYDLGSTGTSTVQWVNAHNISFIGESKDGVIICGTSRDISNPVLNIRYGSGQYMQDLTVRNLTDFDKSGREAVSVAVYGGNHAIFKNVAMQAQQDTQVTGERSYAVDCDFYGAVDFICGGGDHFYDQCRFVITNSGFITAPSTNAANKWGYVMQHCTIDQYVGSYTYEAEGHFTLGRPWQNEPRNYWLNTTMNVKPAEAGWGGMGTLPTHFYEYNSLDGNGNAIDLSVRGNSPSSTNHYTPVLTAEEAAKFTVENVLGGTDSWLPTDYTHEVAAPTVSLEGSTLSWTAVDDARCYVIFKNGEYLTNQTTTSYELSDEGIYSVRAANEMGGLGAAATDIVFKRTIAADKWSTIVVPFDIADSDIKTVFGSDAVVAELQSGTDETLTFTTTLTDGKMNANQPYAIKVSDDFTSAAIQHVTITEAAPTQTVGAWQFVGTYAAVNIPAGSYFFSGNKLYKATGSANTIKPFRAYFTYIGSGEARDLNFIIDGETTSLSEELRVKSEEFAPAAAVYDLQGRRISQPQKGLYIVNGKKVVIK